MTLHTHPPSPPFTCRLLTEGVVPDTCLQMRSVILLSHSPQHSKRFPRQSTSMHSTKSSPGSGKPAAVASHQLPYRPSPSTPDFPPNGYSEGWSTPASYSSPCSSHFLYTSPTYNTQNVTNDLFRAPTRCPILDFLYPSPALCLVGLPLLFPFLCF